MLRRWKPDLETESTTMPGHLVEQQRQRMRDAVEVVMTGLRDFERASATDDFDLTMQARGMALQIEQWVSALELRLGRRADDLLK
jgi:hypothetical protein